MGYPMQGQRPHLTETSPLTGFYMMGTIVLLLSQQVTATRGLPV